MSSLLHYSRFSWGFRVFFEILTSMIYISRLVKDRSSPGNCSKSWRWPTLASTIIGDALTTQTSFTLGFLDDLFGRVLKRRDPKPAERAKELGTRESGDFGGSLLGKHFQLIPFHRGRQALGSCELGLEVSLFA